MPAKMGNPACRIGRWAMALRHQLAKQYSTSNTLEKAKLGEKSAIVSDLAWLTAISTIGHFGRSCWKVGSLQLVVFYPASVLPSVLRHITALYPDPSKIALTVPVLLWTDYARQQRPYGVGEE